MNVAQPSDPRFNVEVLRGAGVRLSQQNVVAKPNECGTLLALRIYRAILLLFMTWLLAWFLPGHVRGQITMGPRESHSCCADASSAESPINSQPTEKDKANCAVCFWAAGLLPVIPVDFSMIYLERHHEQMARLATQFRSIELPRESLPRGPPALA